MKLRLRVPEARDVIAWGANPRCYTQVGFLDAQQRRGPRRPLVAGAIALKGQNNLARGKACELPASHAATPGCDRGNPLPVPRAGGFRRQHAARGEIMGGCATPGRHSTRCRSCRLPRALMLNGFAVQEFGDVYNNEG